MGSPLTQDYSMTFTDLSTFFFEDIYLPSQQPSPPQKKTLKILFYDYAGKKEKNMLKLYIKTFSLT